MGRLLDEDDVIDAVSRGCQEFRGIFARCEKNLNELPPAQLSRIERELHGKTPEEQYKILYQLMFEYANTFNDARRAVIDWLGE